MEAVVSADYARGLALSNAARSNLSLEEKQLHTVMQGINEEILRVSRYGRSSTVIDYHPNSYCFSPKSYEEVMKVAAVVLKSKGYIVSIDERKLNINW